MPEENELSFDELDAQMGEIEAQGVPAEWAASVKKLRAELKNKREKYGPLEALAPIAALHAEDQQAFVLMAEKLAAQDPAGAAALFMDATKALAEAGEVDINELLGVEPPAAATPEEDAVPEEEKSIEERVAELVEAKLAERDEKSAKDREVARIESKMRELGYNDPSDPRAKLVLSNAYAVEGAADVLDAIQQAHEGLPEFIEKHFTQLASADADGAVPSDEGSLADEIPPPSNDAPRPPKTIDEMAKASRERLESSFTPSPVEDVGV